MADRAVGELAQLLGRMGDLNELRRVLAEVVDRPVGGTAAELLEESRQAAYLIRTEPERTLRCGPLALDRFLARGKSDYVTDSRLSGYRASYWGTSLQQLQSLAADLGTSFQMAKRVDHQARVVVPSIVHWSIGHFAALVDERDGRYLLSDPVFGGEIWISKQAYNEEMSGYALVPVAELPPGWRSVPAGEAEQVRDGVRADE